MYGHQFYQASIKDRVEFLNRELESDQFESLEVLAKDIFIDFEDLKEDMRREGYFFIRDLNRFVLIKLNHAV